MRMSLMGTRRPHSGHASFAAQRNAGEGSRRDGRQYSSDTTTLMQGPNGSRATSTP